MDSRFRSIIAVEEGCIDLTTHCNATAYSQLNDDPISLWIIVMTP
jgi:hypothetical protein